MPNQELILGFIPSILLKASKRLVASMEKNPAQALLLFVSFRAVLSHARPLPYDANSMHIGGEIAKPLLNDTDPQVIDSQYRTQLDAENRFLSPFERGILSENSTEQAKNFAPPINFSTYQEITGFIQYRDQQRNNRAVDLINNGNFTLNINDEHAFNLFEQALQRRLSVVTQAMLNRVTAINAQESHFKRTLLHLSTLNKKDVFFDQVMNHSQALNLDVIDSSGNTALMYAAEKGDLHKVNSLLESGADFTIQTREGERAFHKAIRGRHTHIALHFLDKGELINSRPDDNDMSSAVRSSYSEEAKNNWPPLFYACCYAGSDMVGGFLEKGANVTLFDKTGRNALHVVLASSCAGSYQEKRIKVRKLLQYNVDPWLEGQDRTTPFILALQQNNTEEAARLMLFASGMKPWEDNQVALFSELVGPSEAIIEKKINENKHYFNPEWSTVEQYYRERKTRTAACRNTLVAQGSGDVSVSCEPLLNAVNAETWFFSRDDYYTEYIGPLIREMASHTKRDIVKIVRVLESEFINLAQRIVGYFHLVASINQDATSFEFRKIRQAVDAIKNSRDYTRLTRKYQELLEELERILGARKNDIDSPMSSLNHEDRCSAIQDVWSQREFSAIVELIKHSGPQQELKIEDFHCLLDEIDKLKQPSVKQLTTLKEAINSLKPHDSADSAWQHVSDRIETALKNATGGGRARRQVSAVRFFSIANHLKDTRAEIFHGHSHSTP